jgi:O-antigen ligase
LAQGIYRACASTWGYWFIPVLCIAGFLIPLLSYVVFPNTGLGIVERLMDQDRLIKLAMAVGLGVYYLMFLRFAINRPSVLIILNIYGITVAMYFLLSLGITLRLRPVMFAVLNFPALFYVLRHWRALFFHLPHLAFFASYIAMVTLYYFFFNPFHNNALLVDSQTDYIFLWNYLDYFCATIIAGVTIMRPSDPRPVFDRLNNFIIVYSLFLGLVWIIGFYAGQYKMVLDGFVRATGFFPHPNMYAHYLGFLMVYLFGVYFHNRLSNRKDWIQRLLMPTIGVNTIAMAIGLSQTAMYAAAGAIMVFLGLNFIGYPANRKHTWFVIRLMIIAIPVFLVGFQIIRGKSLFELIAARVENKSSIDWRTQVWDLIAYNIKGNALIWGHGFLSAHDYLFRLTYSPDSPNPVIATHNGFLQLLYEFGLMSVTYVLTLGSLTLGTFVRMSKRVANNPYSWNAFAAAIALAVYSILGTGFDELLNSPPVTICFWVYVTLFYALGRRLQALC